MSSPSHGRHPADLGCGLPPAPQREPLIATLRRATAPQHAAVEALPAMVALMSPAVTWDDYGSYLQRMTRVYGALEPGLLAVLDEGLAPCPDLRPHLRPKLPLLRADLAALGLPAPPIPVPPRIGCLSEAMGGLYVLEGASLGARVIGRHLRRHLPGALGEALEAVAFLGCRDDPQGPSVALAWRQFGASLEALAEGGRIDRESVVAGARAVFERVHRILGADPEGPLAAR